MSKQGNIKIILTFIFFGLGILFFALGVQRYQVLTSTRAVGGESIDITFKTTGNYGQLDQSFGVIVPIDNNQLVNEIDTKFKNSGIFIKLVNPTTLTIENTNFDKLAKSGFKFYLAFEDYTNIQNVLTKFYASYENEVVVELTKVANLDAAETDGLLTENPNIKFHAPYMDLWPTDRNKVKEIFAILSPPKLDALSIHTFVLTPSDSILTDVHLMFDTFFDASKDIGNVDINYPPGSKISLSNIETLEGGDASVEQARRFGIISSAMGASIIAQDRDTNAPIRYIIAGDVSKMAAAEKNILVAYSEFIKKKPSIIWPNAIPTNGNMLKDIEPIVGIIGIENNNYIGILTNVTNSTITANLPDFDSSGYISYSNLLGPGDHITPANTIILQAFETVAFYKSPGPEALRIGDTSQTPTPTLPGGGATPFPTLPNEPKAADQLICDSGDDPYNSNTIKITNKTNTAIDEINAVVFRCKYIPGKIKKGFYKCETCTDADEVNNPDCQAGQFDPAASSDFALAAGETKTISVPVNACEIVQLDVSNNAVHVEDSNSECYNVRSKYTNPAPAARWQGGIAFAISENSTGYNAATGTCIPPTATPKVPTSTPPITVTGTITVTPPGNTPTPTNTPTGTLTPAATSTPTVTPTFSPTPSPTLTNTPTPTPTATNTPVPPTPTNTPLPTSTPTPITQIAVNEQPPGITPWVFITIPIGLILLGLLL